MIRPLRRQRSFAFSFVLAAIVFLVGGVAFWFGLRAFRAQADYRSAQATSLDFSDLSETVDAHALPGIAVLRSSAGDIGRATRTFAEGSATIDLLVALPPLIDPHVEYGVWLVKQGLSDVVDIGALTLRADGTWSGVFLVGPVVGVVDPALYDEIVIMIEERDGNAAPSGDKVGEGTWEDG